MRSTEEVLPFIYTPTGEWETGLLVGGRGGPFLVELLLLPNPYSPLLSVPIFLL